MRAHVLLILFNELGKSGLPSILSFFRNKLNKLNNVEFYLSYGIMITLISHF